MIVDTGTNVGDFKGDFPSPRGGKISQSLPLTFEIVFLFVRGHSSVDGATIFGSRHRGENENAPDLESTGNLALTKTIPCGAILDAIALIVLVASSPHFMTIASSMTDRNKESLLDSINLLNGRAHTVGILTKFEKLCKVFVMLKRLFAGFVILAALVVWVVSKPPMSGFYDARMVVGMVVAACMFFDAAVHA